MIEITTHFYKQLEKEMSDILKGCLLALHKSILALQNKIWDTFL